MLRPSSSSPVRHISRVSKRYKGPGAMRYKCERDYANARAHNQNTNKHSRAPVQTIIQ